MYCLVFVLVWSLLSSSPEMSRCSYTTSLGEDVKPSVPRSTLVNPSLKRVYNNQNQTMHLQYYTIVLINIHAQCHVVLNKARYPASYRLIHISFQAVSVLDKFFW